MRGGRVEGGRGRIGEKEESKGGERGGDKYISKKKRKKRRRKTKTKKKKGKRERSFSQQHTSVPQRILTVPP